ncbi:hypothetical protein KDX22_32730, partial [Burkholderia cenocepacia]|uniref:hypothetical protein n=1 Tax=Burkholderia cenocepacia TaxID=95486 RepID=UPI001B943FFE
MVAPPGAVWHTAQSPASATRRPRSSVAAHGDVACNVAMQLAKPLGTNPRQLAEQIVA